MAVLAYDGTGFHGWQVQPALHTVQGALAEAILQVTSETVLPQGSGRTDAGVHALGQVATFALEVPIPGDNLHHALNRALPASIRVLSVQQVEAGFHARYDAVRKTYEYRIFPRSVVDRLGGRLPDRICSPMLARYVWDCGWPLDVTRMQQAAELVVGEHDFTSFAAVDPDLTARNSLAMPTDLDRRNNLAPSAAGSARSTQPHLSCTSAPFEAHSKSNIRQIERSAWSDEDGLPVYRVTGTGFLHHMVRNMVGTFVDVGAGRIAPSAIVKILAARQRSAAGPTAPACGLFLVSVEYAMGVASAELRAAVRPDVRSDASSDVRLDVHSDLPSNVQTDTAVIA